MNSLFLLIPLGIVMVAAALWAFIWAVGSGQFDDLESPAHRVLMEENDRPTTETEKPNGDGSAEHD